MLMFLASVIEQLDLSLEHVSKGDVHNARFSLMLTDNAVELVLHQIAKDKASKLKWMHDGKDYEHTEALNKALKKSFDAKVKFAKLEGKLTDEAAHTILTMHEFRNEVYHIGIKHESILPALSVFYFDFACRVVSLYAPYGLGWSSGQVLPERAKKYFTGAGYFPAKEGEFTKACITLADAAKHDPSRTIDTLADEMDRIIEHIDTCIDIVADGVYAHQKTTRDNAVVQTQTWQLAFTEEGRQFAFSKGWSGSILQLVDWLAEHYPISVRSDPILAWKKRAASLRAEKNPHAALFKYQIFVSDTEAIRDALESSAAQAEAEIDRLIDQRRGK